MPTDGATSVYADRRIPMGGDFLSAEALKTLDPAELTRRMHELAPMIAAHAAEAEQLRRPADAVWQALRQSGFFYQFVPKRFGGMETDFGSFIDASLVIAENDASTAWVATFCAEHNWVLAHFPIETQAAIWGGDFPYIVAPYVTAPPGLAKPVEGGYHLSGQWKWATGVMHADWVIVTALIASEDGPPTPLTALVPAVEVKVLDTWHVDGMAGTGSNDILIEDLFVPAERTVPNLTRNGRPPEQREHANPIYGAPMLPFLTLSASIPALGAARAIVRAHRGRLANHIRLGSMSSQAEKPAAQIRLARAEVMIRNAELLIRDAAGRLPGLGVVEEPEQTAERIAVRAQLAHAVAICKEAAFLLADGAGSGVHMTDHPFQRNLRDIIVLSTHVVFDLDSAYELHGRSLIGLPPNSMLT
jgi:alkylation response protein AidB-like acyl-CoA dehydrogenase